MSNPLTKYFRALECASEEKAVLSCNLRVCKSIKNFRGMAPNTKEAVKKYIPIMEKRIAILNKRLNS